MKKNKLIILLVVLTIIFIILGTFLLKKNKELQDSKIQIINAYYKCQSAKEIFYEDDDYVYSFPCIQSNATYVKFSNGNKMLVVKALEDKKVTIDELMAKSKLDFSTITSALVSLEAEGLIVSEAGRYSSKDVSESKNDNIPHTIPNDAEESSISSDAEKNTISGDAEKTIYSLIKEHSKITIDELMLKSKLDFSDTVSALITLEADGLIMNQAGRYIVNS